VTKANKNRANKNKANNISGHWYQERVRETKASFNLAIILSATTAIFGLIAIVSLVSLVVVPSNFMKRQAKALMKLQKHF
jgi:type IV secretory pathway component VirB8